MTAHGTLRGHPVTWDETATIWRYSDHAAATEPRPCVACGLKFPNGEPDPCVGVVPGLDSFCCGHGVEAPYAVVEREPVEIRHRFETGACRISSDFFLSLPCVLHGRKAETNQAEIELSNRYAHEAQQASPVDYLRVGRHLGMVDPDVWVPMVCKRIDAAVAARGFRNVWLVARMLEQDGGAA